MARQSPPTEIERLIRAAENSRRKLEADVTAFRHKIDVPSRMKESLSGHPTGWMLGSAVSGLAASLLLGRRRKKVHVSPVRRGGLFGLLFAAVIAIAKPLARMLLSHQIRSWADRRTAFPVSPRSSLQVRPDRLESR